MRLYEVRGAKGCEIQEVREAPELSGVCGIVVGLVVLS